MDIGETLSQLAVGGIGGLVAYLLARAQFVSEKRWEHLYEMHCELFHCLHDIDNAISRLAIKDAQHEEQRGNDLESYSSCIDRLLRTEERLTLLGADGARSRLGTLLEEVVGTQPPELYRELSGPLPDSVSEWSDAARASVKDGRLDLAIVGREELRIGLRRRKNKVAHFFESEGQGGPGLPIVERREG